MIEFLLGIGIGMAIGGRMAYSFYKWQKELTGWTLVEQGLPQVDTYVLWIYENGFVIYEAIDKDWDEDYLRFFLKGRGNWHLHGKVVGWMLPPPLPDNYPNPAATESGAVL